MSTHNICFYGELEKIITEITKYLLSLFKCVRAVCPGYSGKIHRFRSSCTCMKYHPGLLNLINDFFFFRPW